MNRFIALLVLVALLLAGCWSRRETNELAMVSMVGIDLTESGETALWLSVAKMTNTSSMARGAGGQSSVTIKGSGASIEAAAFRIQTRLPRQIYWRHVGLVLVGENLARRGISPVLDFLARQPEVRLSSFVLLADGDLDRIMSAPMVLETLPAKGLLTLARDHRFPTAQAVQLVNMLGGIGQDPILGVLGFDGSTEHGPSDHPSQLQVARTALLKRDRLVGTLDERLSRGLMWVREPVRKLTLPVELPGQGGTVTLVRVRSKLKQTASLQRGRLMMTVTVDVRGDVGEVGDHPDVADPDVLKQVERAASDQIRAEITAAVAHLQELNADAAGFGEIVHRQLPGFWRQASAAWGKTGFKELEVIPLVSVSLEHVGVSQSPVTVMPTNPR